MGLQLRAVILPINDEFIEFIMTVTWDFIALKFSAIALVKLALLKSSLYEITNF